MLGKCEREEELPTEEIHNFHATDSERISFLVIKTQPSVLFDENEMYIENASVKQFLASEKCLNAVLKETSPPTKWIEIISHFEKKKPSHFLNVLMPADFLS